MNISRILNGLDPTREPSFGEQIRTYLSPLLFWSAIVLPLLYLPLIATGLHTQTDVLRLVALLILHVVALLGSHSHNPR